MSNANAIPLSYTTPPFPSLYWPFRLSPGQAKYLYTVTDIWKFTLYWTLITTSLAHLVVALWAIFMQFLAANERARYLKTFDGGTQGTPDGEEDANTSQSESEDESSFHDAPETTKARVFEKLGAETQPVQTQAHTTSRSGANARRKAPRRRKLSAKNRKLLGSSPYRSFVQYAGLIFAVYIVIGAIEAFIAGGLVGVVLGAVYNAGYFRMSVWTPLFWGIINMLVLILSSFHISGGM